MKNIVIHTTNYNLQPAQIDSFEKLYKKYSIPSFVFTKKISKKDFSRKSELKTKWVFLKEYKTKDDLILQIKQLRNWYIWCFDETLINFINEIKKDLWLEYTLHYKAFTDKNLQRKLLLNYDKSITVNFIKTHINDITDKKIGLIWYPFIIKPIWWTASKGVKIIKNKSDLENYIKNYHKVFQKLEDSWFKINDVLLEEYIDWTAWSIDYFVDKNQNIYITKHVFLEFWIDFWIDDFCNISRIISQEKENELDLEQLKDFLEKNIKALWIKNTFVHHEFKFTSKWQFKTIELNWRIGWFRLNMYQQAYSFNLLEIPFINLKPWFINLKLKNNYSIVTLYPKEEWIFNWINIDIEKQIRNLASFEKIILLNKYINKKIGLAKQGYQAVWNIKLKNNNFQQFKKDYNFLKENYFKLLKIS